MLRFAATGQQYLPRSNPQLALLRDPTHSTPKKTDTWFWFPLDHFCQIEFHPDAQKLLGRARLGYILVNDGRARSLAEGWQSSHDPAGVCRE